MASFLDPQSQNNQPDQTAPTDAAPPPAVAAPADSIVPNPGFAQFNAHMLMTVQALNQLYQAFVNRGS